MIQLKLKNKISSCFHSFLEISPSSFLLAIIVFLIPLIVYLRILDYESVVQTICGKKQNFNVFSFHKFVWLAILSFSALFFFKIESKTIKNCGYYLPLIGFIYLSALSTIFSEFPAMALFGSVDRHGGFFTQLCYVAIFFLSFNLGHEKRTIKMVLIAISFSALLLFPLGICQLSGYDYLYGGFADAYLTSDHTRASFPEFRLSDFQPAEVSLVYLTFGNSNYTGSYMALVFVLTFGLLLGLQGKAKIICFIVNSMVFFNLIASQSRAGYIGSFFAGFVLLLAQRKRIMTQKYLFCFLLMVYLAIFFFVSNKLSVKEIFRPPIAKSGYWGNFKDLRIENGEALLTFDSQDIKIVSLNDRIEFFDHKHRKVSYNLRKIEENLPLNGPRSLNSSSSVNNNLNSSIKSNRRFESGNSDVISKDFEKFQVVFSSLFFRGFEIFVWPTLNVIQISRGKNAVFLSYSNDGFNFLDHLGNRAKFKAAPSIGFSGIENFGSSRGYIWSRTLPLLSNCLLLGYGPDTFVTFYPNDDHRGKLRYLTRGLFSFVTKPHCLFLQIATENGLLSLVFLLLMFGAYLKRSAELYWNSNLENVYSSIGIALSLSVFAYLLSCFFNDGDIGVEPVFWCLFGLGVSVNRVLEEKCLKIECKENHEF